MDKELKTKWVEALRSGKYKQARNTMKDKDGGMCCLGVLREVVAPGDETSRHGQNMMPTDELAAIVGVPVYLGDPDEAEKITLARFSQLNDGGATFADIADEIERRL